MKRITLVLTALFLAACTATPDKAVDETDPVQDFIRLHELKSISSIRRFDNPGALPVNARYIIAYLKDEQYLLQYSHDCRLAEMDTANRLPDSRRRGRVLSARTDTFRGCPVRKMYPITYAQAEEVMAIGRGTEQ
jgi:hypothetical protein